MVKKLLMNLRKYLSNKDSPGIKHLMHKQKEENEKEKRRVILTEVTCLESWIA